MCSAPVCKVLGIEIKKLYNLPFCCSLQIDDETYGGFRRLSATFEELEEKANASEDTEEEIKSRETSIARYAAHNFKVSYFLVFLELNGRKILILKAKITSLSNSDLNNLGF